MQRREFLKLQMATTAVAAWVGSLGVAERAFAEAGSDYARTLILVELKGANDALNTVVPYADPTYYRLRPRIAIKRDGVVQLDERAGLHPALASMQALWQSGELAIVEGLGYAAPNLSHFRSIEIWETASDATEYRSDGWLARTFAANPAPRSVATDGIVIGSAELGPFAGAGARAIALSNIEQFVRQARLAQPTVAAGNPALAHILRVEGNVKAAAQELGDGLANEVRERRDLRTVFPSHAFGQAVKTAAQVVATNVRVPAIRLTLNGFDTHQNQSGAHANLLKQLGEGLDALRGALVELGRWDRTLVMTYSEFGRRAAENGSSGTDHGTASAHFVLGGRVRGGWYGEPPLLDRLENGNLRFAVEYRSLYATALERWWGISSEPILGRRYPTLELIKT